MKTTGIIAEYNPFHNGHKYHLQKAKELTGCDYSIVIMSGDYMQRGTPAIYSKYVRAKTALLAGADLVLEMPVFGSVASAPDFAHCGVNSLAATGICDYLFFGSENGSIEELLHQTTTLECESEEISERIKEGLKQGLTWPQARSRAYNLNCISDGNETNIVSALPNDILGVEYIRALREANASIIPATIKRADPGYHSEERSGAFASATAARKAILEDNLAFLEEVLPDEFFSCMIEESCPPVAFNDYSLLLCEKLLCASLNDLYEISGMPEDLANKLFKNKRDYFTAEQLVSERKDRNYTYTRINRCLLNTMLGITKSDAELFKKLNYAPWLRILGFRKDSGPLLSELKKHAEIPIISKMANAETLLNEEAMCLFQKHVQTAELYRLISQLKSGRVARNEYRQQIIIV